MPHATASDSLVRATTQVPDAEGRFGEFGRRFVPETLMHALEELTREYEKARKDPAFQAELDGLLKTFVGRPSPLHFAERLTQKCGGARIYLKREDLNHTGAHKINNTIGQGLLTLRMGKKRVIAETGAGQHGVATATACARFGLECVVYMGEEDIRRQRLNVFSMRMLGAEVRPVTSGSRTLRDAINEAMRDWMTSVADTHYILGSVVGPHPFPMMVRDFQAVIGRETRANASSNWVGCRDEVVACVGGGCNSAGMFYPFIEDESVALTGVEAGGRGPSPATMPARSLTVPTACCTAASATSCKMTTGRPSTCIPFPPASIIPGVGPEHSYWKDSGRVEYVSIRDQEALDAFETLAQLEGILPALESSHAVAQVLKTAGQRSKDDMVVICLSGRGDKDVYEVARLLGKEI